LHCTTFKYYFFYLTTTHLKNILHHYTHIS